MRALHHYDRLGLLKPLRNGRTGYRAYRDSDFARLEQIVVLKFLGIPLREMGPLLKTPKSASLRDVLQKQRRVLWQKRRHLDAAIVAVERAERSLGGTNEPDWKLFTLVVKEIEMQNDNVGRNALGKRESGIDARRVLDGCRSARPATGQLIADVSAAAAR